MGITISQILQRLRLRLREIDREIEKERERERKERKMQREEEEKVRLGLGQLAQTLMIMMVLLSRSATENRLTRTQWDPGKSLFEKIVKTSWDVHLNPGPPERIGPHSLTLEEFNLSKYEEQHGIRKDG